MTARSPVPVHHQPPPTVSISLYYVGAILAAPRTPRLARSGLRKIIDEDSANRERGSKMKRDRIHRFSDELVKLRKNDLPPVGIGHDTEEESGP